MSGAILSPANIVIRRWSAATDTFAYTATGGISSNFSITTSGGNGSQSFTNIAAGSYTVTESAPPAGWDFTNLVCVDEDGGSTVDLGHRKANIDLDPGETVTCTYTNTKRGKIIIEKQTLPDGSPQLFTFTRSYGSNVQLSDGQQNDSGFLAAGHVLGLRDGAERLDADVVHLRRRLEPGLDLAAGRRDGEVHVQQRPERPGHRQEGHGRRHRHVRLLGYAVGRDRRQQRNDLSGSRPRSVHVDRGGEGRLGPELDLVQRRQLVGLGCERGRRPSTSRRARR